MQLSPRQYQADPTGAAYVQDTRPLMAAMGAQAASQIESNRMMTETMQRGMKGVENFAARRQLAAARVQLGQLKLTDPDYGQKLSGLVMDNPLAFTNEKTAPVANFAFKQAANDFQSKRESEQKMADAYRAYLYQRDVAGMNINARSSDISKQNAQYAANVYRPQLAAINRSLEEVRKNKSERPKEAKYWERRESELLTQKTGIEGNYQETLDAVPLRKTNDFGAPVPPPTALPALPFMPDEVNPAASSSEDFTNASTYANSAGNGAPLPPPGDSGELFLALNPQIQDRGYYGSAPRAEAVPETEVYIPTDPTLTPDVAAPAGTVTPVTAAAAAPTAAAVAPTTADADAEYMAAEQEVARRLGKEKTTGAAGKMTQSQIDNLAVTHPDVRKARLERDVLRKDYDSAENELRKAEKSEDETLITAANTVLKEVSSKLTTAENNFLDTEAAVKIRASLAENPFDFLSSEEAIFEVEKRKAAKAAAESQKVKLTDVTSPEEINAFLAATRVTPAAAPPDPTIGMSALQKEVYNIEAKRQEAPLRRAAEKEARRVESNAQWNQAKGEVYNLIGGSEGLAEILGATEQPLIEGIDYGVDMELTKTRTANQLAQKIREKISANSKEGKLKGFKQKLERLGFQDVSQEEIIAAVVDEIMKARESTAGKVSTMPRAMASPAGTPVSQPVREALGNTNVIPK